MRSAGCASAEGAGAGAYPGNRTDSKNLLLGYERAFAVYQDIRRHSKEVPDHVVLCTHADNTPAKEVPLFTGTLSQAQAQALGEAKSKNRRITIEDHVNSVVKDE